MSTPEPLAIKAVAGPWRCPGSRLVLAADAPREDWLAARRTLIGSSDVAKLFGVSKYGDAYSLWADKRGLVPDEPANDAMRRGQIFEDPIVQLWAERVAEFPIRTRRAGLMRSRTHDHCGATVDRLSVCEQYGLTHRCIVEVKSQADMSEWEDGEVPASFQLQGLWQLAVTGRDHVHYVAMDGRFVPHHRQIERDPEVQAAMLERAQVFWHDRIEGDDPPQPTAGDLDAIRRSHYRTSPRKAFVITDELTPHVHALLAAKGEVDAATEQYTTAQTIVMTAMGDATELVWPDGVVAATWRAGSTIDGANAKWRTANADLVQAYSLPVPEHVELDVKKLVENEPHLIDSGQLRYRRTFNLVKPKAAQA